MNPHTPSWCELALFLCFMIKAFSKNKFTFKVNDEDIYSLTKEEVDFDPSKTETLATNLKINEIQAISDSMPWIIDEVEEKI